ncbi:hypothetical protein M0805_002053 [Coniferiporia weirii]|nr:hypothetical protein M0805_002053 [Coniferiporia weirii]
MLIDLPPICEYNMADIACEDLFVSSLDDNYNDGGAARKYAMMASGCIASDPMVFSDPESSIYTSASASESDLDPCDVLMSDGDTTDHALIESSQKDLRSVLALGENQMEREVALHSPGMLLGTPRYASRRYEYPFPTDSNLTDVGLALSTASTPGLSPPIAGTPSPESSSSGVSPSASSTSIDTGSSASSVSATLQTPAAACLLISVASSSSTSLISPVGVLLSPVSLVPLVHTPPLTGPTATHPGLLRFNHADTPVPPGLRGRARKSTSLDAQTAVPTAPRGN